jgi:hypothetical protein
MRFMNTKSLMIASVCLAVMLTLTGAIDRPDPLLATAVMGVGMLDVFKQDAFSIISLTDAINKLPFIPGRAGVIIDWNENGVATTSIAIEEVNGVLQMVNPTARGGPGASVPKQKRVARQLTIPHYQVDDAIYAEEVQGVRAFGQENQVQTVLGQVNARMEQHMQLVLDPTLEYQRVGALKGIIINQDGSTMYNLFTEFGVGQPGEVAFDFTVKVDGAVRAVCDGISRTIATALGGLTFTGVYSFCSDSFWDALVSNKEVRATYLNQQEASQLREGTAYQTFNFGGITFENYRGAVGATKFIADDKANFFPRGVPGLWRTVYAPADYIETVNTIGLPRYAKQYPMENGKGINLECQSNPLSYCTRPGVLVQGKLGAA